MSDEIILIFVTCPNKKEAKTLASILLHKHLAACVSVFPVQSFYWWEGKQAEENEVEVIIKTKKDLFEEIKDEIEKTHPYIVPQIIAVDSAMVNEKYKRWVTSEVR